jgi:hypothetical protein
MPKNVLRCSPGQKKLVLAFLEQEKDTRRKSKDKENSQANQERIDLAAHETKEWNINNRIFP